MQVVAADAGSKGLHMSALRLSSRHLQMVIWGERNRFVYSYS
jgi:hypothetical protein